MTDKEFLVELAKRLVYKYAENPSILSRVEEILKKIDHQERITKSNYKIIQSCIAKSIDDLKVLHSKLEPVNEPTQEEKIKLKKQVSEFFHNLDVDKLLK